jgi:hypothetical protein
VPDDRTTAGLPPDLPPEYAEAYRRGFERAYGQGPEPDLVEEELAAAPRRAYTGPSHRDQEQGERPVWLVPAILAGLMGLLLVAAYGMGLLLSSSVDDGDLAEPEPDGVVMGEGSEPAASRSSTPEPSPQASPERYGGRTEPATIGGATGSCQSPDSVDAAGNPVAYPAVNSHDGDLTTALRCDGGGVGETLTLTLPDAVRIGEVGLVPGYAKTDPRDGADRYAENNRITRVRWTFSDGSTVVQRLDGSATNREMQTVRIALTEADSVVLEVLASTRGARNTIAVSEVLVAAATE